MTKSAKPVKDRQTYDVYLEAAELGIQEQVGLLQRNLHKADLPASFQYMASWESHPGRFMLDPRLDIHSGLQFPNHGMPGFGIFLDSAPDRWGRMLMERREAAEAERENRPMNVLRELDFFECARRYPHGCPAFSQVRGRQFLGRPH